MWQNTQLPVICESNRPHSLFSRHMRASSLATFTFCSSPFSLSSHLLPGAGFPHPTCLMERNGLGVRRYWIRQLSNLLLPLLSQSNQEVSLEFCSTGWIQLNLGHFAVCVWRICWCKHGWKWGALTQAPTEVQLGADSNVDFTSNPRKFSKNANNKNLMKRKRWLYSGWLIENPPIHTSNHPISPLIHTKQKWERISKKSRERTRTRASLMLITLPLSGVKCTSQAVSASLQIPDRQTESRRMLL